jgi:hypothetical protein
LARHSWAPMPEGPHLFVRIAQRLTLGQLPFPNPISCV